MGTLDAYRLSQLERRLNALEQRGGYLLFPPEVERGMMYDAFGPNAAAAKEHFFQGEHQKVPWHIEGLFDSIGLEPVEP